MATMVIGSSLPLSHQALHANTHAGVLPITIVACSFCHPWRDPKLVARTFEHTRRDADLASS